MNRRLAIVLLSALAVGSMGSRPASAADPEAELQRLRAAILISRERVSTYGRDERGLLEALEALDRSISILSEAVAHASHRAERARLLLGEIETELARIARRLERVRRAMSDRAAALYRAGDLGAVRMLFSAESLREFLSRVYALRILLTHDAELLARHRSESEALGLAETRAREASVANDEAAAQRQERAQQLRQEQALKRALAARVHADRSRERSALVELETATRALEETLASLGSSRERPPLEGLFFSALRGALEPPVAAPIASEFGRVVDTEFQTQTLRKGVEFLAPLGSPVRAVAAGRVGFAGWFRGYGRLVILDHGDHYFTVSGHLDSIEVEVGDDVVAGQRIGSVGETGSLSGPRLYFEIRRGGRSLDPRQWIPASQAG
ncbi:MAG: peptidoglycan DD-metalloendopeptidase family protein [Myxococcota bacterium]